jgi:hypothetical protein
LASKKKLAELILRRIEGGDRSDDSQIDIREVILLIEQKAAEILRTDYFIQRKEGEKSINGELIARFYDIEVLHDEKRNLNYILLPTRFLRLPGDIGIHHLSFQGDEQNAFIPQSTGSLALRKRSPAKGLEGNIGYWPEADRVYFNQRIKKDGCLVFGKFVFPMDSDSDNLPVPADIENGILLAVLAQLKNMPQDKVVDSNNTK